QWVASLAEVHIHGLLYSKTSRFPKIHGASERAMEHPVPSESLKTILQFLSPADLLTAVQAFGSGYIVGKQTNNGDPKAILEGILQKVRAKRVHLSAVVLHLDFCFGCHTWNLSRDKRFPRGWPDRMARELREKFHVNVVVIGAGSRCENLPFDRLFQGLGWKPSSHTSFESHPFAFLSQSQRTYVYDIHGRRESTPMIRRFRRKRMTLSGTGACVLGSSIFEGRDWVDVIAPYFVSSGCRRDELLNGDDEISRDQDGGSPIMCRFGNGKGSFSYVSTLYIDGVGALVHRLCFPVEYYRATKERDAKYLADNHARICEANETAKQLIAHWEAQGPRNTRFTNKLKQLVEEQYKEHLCKSRPDIFVVLNVEKAWSVSRKIFVTHENLVRFLEISIDPPVLYPAEAVLYPAAAADSFFKILARYQETFEDYQVANMRLQMSVWKSHLLKEGEEEQLRD
ncbi:MAG: hypothetical protein SGILL_008508, partial [Bacillariaceae sp.]